MARPKKNKNLPEYMTERKGYYETRRPIHDGERHHFPELTGQRAVKVMPVGRIGSSQRPTKTDIEKHNANLDEIEARISAGSGVPIWTDRTDRKTLPGVVYAPEQIIEAITKWERISFRDRRLAYCNGALALIEPFSKQRMEWSQQIAKLREQLSAYRDSDRVNLPTTDQEEIKAGMLAALAQMGVSLSCDSPMASHKGILTIYLSVRISLEEKSLRVATGDFGVEPDEDEPDDDERTSLSQFSDKKSVVGWRLSELFEKYQGVSKYRRNLDKKKRFWSLLIRNIGDQLVQNITPMAFQICQPLIHLGQFIEDPIALLLNEGGDVRFVRRHRGDDFHMLRSYDDAFFMGSRACADVVGDGDFTDLNLTHH
nr:hypothetical protein [Asticcacaulis benevestitus]